MNDQMHKPQSAISEESKLDEARSIRASVLVQKKVPKNVNTKSTKQETIHH